MANKWPYIVHILGMFSTIGDHKVDISSYMQYRLSNQYQKQTVSAGKGVYKWFVYRMSTHTE